MANLIRTIPTIAITSTATPITGIQCVELSKEGIGLVEGLGHFHIGVVVAQARAPGPTETGQAEIRDLVGLSLVGRWIGKELVGRGKLLGVHIAGVLVRSNI
eukprot:TRINITY_DN6428_c0_g2_i3.p1 TRINITY_DN6428_c0_g2~~TRINITY_DN6428_c0_g2_i3.p1  ORF type:complete len:102 (-),score=16.54 TRINITY_DN6428_c0_g2_i3:174-479(-)